MLLKRCSSCKYEKDLDDFSNNRTGKYGKHHTCKVCKAKEQKARHYKSKMELVAKYCKDGIIKCQCEKCEVNNIKFLTIDHCNNDGKEHRKSIGCGMWAFYWWAKKHNFPEGFRILCYNCNCARAKNGGICPHMEGSGSEHE